MADVLLAIAGGAFVAALIVGYVAAVACACLSARLDGDAD